MVKQDSHGAAELERSTFQQSPKLASADVEAGIDPSIWQFNHAQRSIRSSWNFYSRGTADMEGPQALQGLLGGTTAMAAFLFNINDTSEQAPRLVNDSQRVAGMLVAHSDIATRMAFARAPKAAWNITSTPEINGWSYDPTVLLILAAPLLATALVLCICWQVYSDDVAVGYNFIVIARRAGEITTHSTATEDLPGTGDLEESTKLNGAYSSIDSLPSSFAEQDHERRSGAVKTSESPRPDVF